MKMKLKEILPLNLLIREIINSNKIPVKAVFKFKLLGIARTLEAPVNNFEQVRVEKVKEYGKENRDKKGKVRGYDIKPNSKEEKLFQKDMEDLLNSEITVDIQKLKAQEVFDSGIPADYLVHLYNIIEE